MEPWRVTAAFVGFALGIAGATLSVIWNVTHSQSGVFIPNFWILLLATVIALIGFFLWGIATFSDISCFESYSREWLIFFGILFWLAILIAFIVSGVVSGAPISS